MHIFMNLEACPRHEIFFQQEGVLERNPKNSVMKQGTTQPIGLMNRILQIASFVYVIADF